MELKTQQEVDREREREGGERGRTKMQNPSIIRANFCKYIFIINLNVSEDVYAFKMDSSTDRCKRCYGHFVDTHSFSYIAKIETLPIPTVSA